MVLNLPHGGPVALCRNILCLNHGECSGLPGQGCHGRRCRKWYPVIVCCAGKPSLAGFQTLFSTLQSEACQDQQQRTCSRRPEREKCMQWRHPTWQRLQIYSKKRIRVRSSSCSCVHSAGEMTCAGHFESGTRKGMSKLLAMTQQLCVLVQLWEPGLK